MNETKSHSTKLWGRTAAAALRTAGLEVSSTQNAGTVGVWVTPVSGGSTPEEIVAVLEARGFHNVKVVGDEFPMVHGIAPGQV